MVEKIASNSHLYRHKGKVLPMLLISDVHFDSLKCDRDSLKAHLDDIKKRNGIVLIIGDLFDVMGTFQDPRSKPQEIRKEYYQKGRSYLDLVIEDCFEFLKPYRDNIKLISYGNHETNIIRRHDTDPIDRLVYLLNMEGQKVQKGAYQGFFSVLMDDGGRISSFKIAYHHGHGGAKRSKGVLNSQLDVMKYRDADLIISGHDHNKIHDPSNVVIKLDHQMKPVQSVVHWLKLGSYKMSSTDMGWAVERGFNPSKTGGWFCDIQQIRTTVDGRRKVWAEPKIWEAAPVSYSY